VIRTAIASIRNGAQLTFEIRTQYLSAAVNRADVRARQAESDEAAAAFENAKRPKGSHVDEFGEAVLDRLTDLLGVDDGGIIFIEPA